MSGMDRDKDAPSLEPPSLFGRKRRKKQAAQAPDAFAAPAAPAAPSVEETRVDVPVVEPDETPTAAVPVVPRPARPAAPATPAPEPVREPEPTPPPLFADEAAAPTPTPASVLTDPDPEPTPHSVAPQQPQEPREPFVTGLPAACLTGALVGLATVGLTWAGLRVCEVAKGTTSCGNPGFLLLIAILVAMVLAGSALLRYFRVPDATSTSFLAVGLLTVLVLLFLIEVLFSWAMVIVIPVLAVGCFAASWWVTTSLASSTDED